jgi:uncharacterized membrane protein
LSLLRLSLLLALGFPALAAGPATLGCRCFAALLVASLALACWGRLVVCCLLLLLLALLPGLLLALPFPAALSVPLRLGLCTNSRAT